MPGWNLYSTRQGNRIYYLYFNANSDHPAGPDRYCVYFYAVTDVLCNGASSGSISISPSGGRRYFEYPSMAVQHINQPEYSITCPGSYYLIRIRINQGCIKDTTVNIAEPTALNATAVSTNATCTQFGSIEYQ